MNTKTAAKKVFAQHLMVGDAVYGGTLSAKGKPSMVNGSLVVRLTVDMGEGFLPRFESFDRMALDIVSVTN
jgi:hypothetical protein